MEQSLIEANKPRAILIASLIVPRLQQAGHVGAWHGYDPSEGLDGELVQDGLLRYARRGAEEYAVLFFKEPQLTDIETVDWGTERIVEKSVVERYTSEIDKIPGVEYDDTISHTFSKTKTMQEAFKLGAEVAVKAGLSAYGATGEVSAKLTAEYSRQWGESQTETDTVTRHILLPVDYAGDLTFEAVRSVNKVQRTVTATTNMDYQIAFVSGPSIPPENRPYYDFNWASLEEFISVGTGFAAADKAMYAEFMAVKLSDGAVEKLKKSGQQSVKFDLNYDSVVSQSIKMRHNNERS